jgi:hypothetical protein
MLATKDRLNDGTGTASTLTLTKRLQFQFRIQTAVFGPTRLVNGMGLTWTNMKRHGKN